VESNRQGKVGRYFYRCYNTIRKYDRGAGVVVSVIAIDGPVASGKTVVGRALARCLGFKFLDTGVMYRAITWLALCRNISVNDETSLGRLAKTTPISLKGQDSDRVLVGMNEVGSELRDPRVDSHVSLVSQVPGVRRALVQQQRMLAREGKIVMVGRDIGTVVLPDAPLKVFMSASVEERARRRWQDLLRQGHQADFSQVLRQTRERDRLDSQRADSPLTPAKDAFLLDTGGLSIQQVVDQILQWVHQNPGGQ
jgi:cytidylate kinase